MECIPRAQFDQPAVAVAEHLAGLTAGFLRGERDRSVRSHDRTDL
jgi:hypothetical protein